MKRTLTLASMLALFAAPALAHDHDKSMHGDKMHGGKMEQKVDYYFNKIDTNNDGMITKAEHDAFGNRMFTEADTDKNGSLSREELEAAKMQEKQQWKNNMQDTSNTRSNPPKPGVTTKGENTGRQ